MKRNINAFMYINILVFDYSINVPFVSIICTLYTIIVQKGMMLLGQAKLSKDLLWVLEQIPGYIQLGDMTQVAIQWPENTPSSRS